MAFSASLEDAVHDRTVYVITPYEDYSLLKEKDHYMTIGETYTFCARKLPTAVKSKAHYKIDDINTIVKI